MPNVRVEPSLNPAPADQGSALRVSTFSRRYRCAGLGPARADPPPRPGKVRDVGARDIRVYPNIFSQTAGSKNQILRTRNPPLSGILASYHRSFNDVNSHYSLRCAPWGIFWREVTLSRNERRPRDDWDMARIEWLQADIGASPSRL